MNYKEYFDKTFNIKVFELSDNNKNAQDKMLGSLASINALNSSTSIRELSSLLVTEIKDITEIFIDTLNDTLDTFSHVLDISLDVIIDMFSRYLKVYISSNENRLSDFMRSQSFPQGTFQSAIRGYHLGINQILEINKSRIELIFRNKEISNDKKEETDTFKKSKNIENVWITIESEYGITKRAFGRKINFVTDKFKRSIIFRDIEQSFELARLGFSKPAVILAGSVIEELLRLYLEKNKIKPQKNDFNAYIIACEQSGLLKSAISRLSDSVRHFRNIVHLGKEKSERYTISIPTAKGAVASIFTIANDF